MAFANVSESDSSSYIFTQFPLWFKQQVYGATPTVEILHLRNLSEGPHRLVKEWHTYFVNGYKFHTHYWTEGKKTINSGVHVKGVTEGGEDDFYGVIKHMYELAYNYLDYKKRVVLFYCDWFDPSTRGTKIDRKYNIVDIRMDRKYKVFDPFIMAHNVRQVYYVSYPSIQVSKRGWCVAITTKPRARIEVETEEHAYQLDEISNINVSIEVEPISGLRDAQVEGVQVDIPILRHNDTGEMSDSSEDEEDEDEELGSDDGIEDEELSDDGSTEEEEEEDEE